MIKRASSENIDTPKLVLLVASQKAIVAWNAFCQFWILYPLFCVIRLEYRDQASIIYALLV